jgi:hypothetical protein
MFVTSAWEVYTASSRNSAASRSRVARAALTDRTGAPNSGRGVSARASLSLCMIALVPVYDRVCLCIPGLYVFPCRDP